MRPWLHRAQFRASPATKIFASFIELTTAQKMNIVLRGTIVNSLSQFTEVCIGKGKS